MGEALITTGAIALALGLVIRINNMAEWIMWVVNGIFENVGTVQDGMKSIVRPRDVLDPETPGRCRWSRAACASRMCISTTASRAG